MQSGLLSRLKRLEGRNRANSAAPPYLITVVKHHPDAGDIVGALSLSGPAIERQKGEPLDKFTSRASIAFGERIMIALYQREYHGFRR